MKDISCKTINYLTIDFEEWYQGLTSTSLMIDRWGSFESRIELQTNWLLETLSESNTKATFFIVGEIARTHPQVVRKIAGEGHRIGLHGNLHQRVDSMSREEFRLDLEQSRNAVESAGGVQVDGFRAPCFSFSENTGWAWEELARLGMTFDSSVFPMRGWNYGISGAPTESYRVSTESGCIQEYPMSTVKILGRNLPFSGGFYFRSLPYCIVKEITRRKNRKGESVMFYFHPWEFDPSHPIAYSTTPRERLSHYGFLSGARKKFRRLLSDFNLMPLHDRLSP